MYIHNVESGNHNVDNTIYNVAQNNKRIEAPIPFFLFSVIFFFKGGLKKIYGFGQNKKKYLLFSA